MKHVTLASVAFLVLAACSGDPGTKVPDEVAPPPAPPAGSSGDPGSSSGTPSTPSTPSNPTTPRLTVSVEGTGRVLSTPAGIDCPGTCSTTFPPGTKVSLFAAAAEGWKLEAWSGDCAETPAPGGGSACVLTMARESKVTSKLALLDVRWDPSVGVADCAAAWGTAGEKLSPCDTVKDDYVVVHKSKRNVALCKNGKLVKNLRAGLGKTPVGDKVKEWDGKTPEGVFYVPRLLPDSTYYKAFLLSYPSVEDAKRGYGAGLITDNQRLVIENAHAACTEPPQDTPLGGDIEIHGNGSKSDWTLGCVAVDDSGIDLLWGAIGVRDTIVVVP
ncbi:MAG: L,D-transpeptidase family protein [Deltaproteobacteria bacterium]|nr:L,D-transpeptidase family protein [Deltaproteobacteria bacterium]